MSEPVRPIPAVGDYVLATKYGDGDPQDHWCVGFYAGLTHPDKYNPPRYDVVDGEGKNFRGNGFRRIKKITQERGAWMLKHSKDIELSGKSVWHFARCSMDSLPTVIVEEESQLYEVVRFFGPTPGRPTEVQLRDLTLEEAQEHCSDPSSEGDGWFDGFRKQEDQ